MPRSSLESLLEERFAQLEAITYRRNELLQQMYHMMRRRHAAGSVLTVDEHDEDLPAFLERFDLNKHPEIGTISNLDDQELELGLSGETETMPMSPSQEHKEPSPNAGLDLRIPLMQTDTNVNTESELEDTSSITADPSPRPRSPTPLANISVKMDDDRDELDLLTPFQIAQPCNPRIVSEISSPHSPQPIQNATNAAGEDHRARSFDVDLGRQDDYLKQSPSQLHEGSIRSATPPLKMDVDKLTQDLVVQGAQENEGLCASRTNQSVEADQLPNFLEPVFEGEPRAYAQVQAQARPEYSAPESSRDSPAIGVSTPQPSLPSPTPEPEATLRPPITIPFPLPSTGQNFIFTPDPTLDPHSTPPVPVQPRHQFDPHYMLPPLKILPPEFNRKSKLLKLQRKREKERERGDAKKDKDSNKEEWRPMGVSRWAATINANPVWKKVSRASKCITTREWGVAMSELKLVRTLDRIESLKVGGRWSFRQPRKQRGIGALVKSHWDHLMDEMKWMRIDFREERRWKMALAYNLSTAVLEWHAAGSQAQRLEEGITVHWKPPNLEEMDMDEPAVREEQISDGINADQIQTTPDQAGSSLLGIDYGSDEDDEDQDKDSQDIVDGLEPSTLIQDILESSADQDAEGGIDDVQLKTEDMDDSVALRTAMETVTLSPKDTTPNNELGHPVITNALKPNSDDPLLGSKSTSQSSVGDTEPVVSTKTSTKISAYGPFREQVAYSEDQRLFFDVHDLDPRQTRTKGSTVDEILSLPPDLISIFPDLQPFGLLDPTPVIGSVPATEGKKKSEKRSDRDDPTKRAEDTTYTKLYPIGRFMHSKPTLLGALQPAKRWKDGSWIPLEEPGVVIETDGPAKITDDSVNDLFDSRSSNSPAAIMAMHMQAAHMLKDKDRRRGADHLWSTNDDALLKSLIDKYSTNWLLISECFNASRVTIPTDKRTTRDCLERWKEKWGPDIRAKPSDAAVEEAPTPPTLSTQMTTRGVKRLASSSVSGPGSASGSEPRKRRRHMLIQDAMRKAAKKRAEVAQKFSANQRKPPAIHETHVQYNKMQKFTPAELSRMKTDKESRDIAMARQLRHPHVPVPALIPQTNGLPRGTPVGVSLAPGASQLRSQVNISQQQRITAPASTSSGTSRLSPQQIAQVQAQAQAQAQRVAQSNQQVVGQAPTAGPAVNGSASAGSHVQSNFNRDTVLSPVHATTINSPRPPSAQAQINIAQTQVATNVPRPSNGHYFLPNPSNMQNFTPEQLHTALRLQMLQASRILPTQTVF